MAQYVVDLRELTGSPAYPADEATLREHGRLAYDRGGADLAAMQRHTRRPSPRPATVARRWYACRRGRAGALAKDQTIGPRWLVSVGGRSA
jgi:hypothetical protein